MFPEKPHVGSEEPGWHFRIDWRATHSNTVVAEDCKTRQRSALESALAPERIHQDCMIASDAFGKAQQARPMDAGSNCLTNQHFCASEAGAATIQRSACCLSSHRQCSPEFQNARDAIIRAPTGTRESRRNSWRLPPCGAAWPHHKNSAGNNLAGECGGH